MATGSDKRLWDANSKLVGARAAHARAVSQRMGITEAKACLDQAWAAWTAIGTRQSAVLCRAFVDAQALLDVPDNIQMFPPGPHKITVDKEGKPTTIELLIDQGTAERLQAGLRARLEKSATNSDDAPFIDFNHGDGEAAGFVTEIFWGGDDPVWGGVRARINWTARGTKAVKGRAYRKFSPAFYQDGKGNVIGSPVNMGGLVNRCAFKTISPIVAGNFDRSGRQVVP